MKRKKLFIKDFWLVLNEKCNNACPYCYAQTKTGGQKMPFSQACQIVKKMASAKAKNCLLIGGEPTLYSQLLPLIKFINQNTILKTILVTNGRLLANKKFAQQLAKVKIGRVVISLEGSCEKIHNQITQTKSFKQTIQGIKNCLGAGLTTATLTTISIFNLDNLPNIAKIAHQLRVSSISFNCAIPPLNSAGSTITIFTPPLKKIAQKIEATYQKSKKENIKVHFNITIPLCLFNQKVIKEMFQNKSISVGCHMFTGSGIAFGPKGNVLPCTHFAAFPLLPKEVNKKGRFSHQDFLKEWQTGKKTTAFRKSLWQYPATKCKTCDYWGICVGGCPLLWLAFRPTEIIE